MKGLTFREVIAIIKKGECYIGNGMQIYMADAEGISIDWLDGECFEGILMFEDELFYLEKEKVSFQDAFKALEEGKKITNVDTEEYFVLSDDIFIESEGDLYRFHGELFSFEDIKSKWYID